MEISGFNTSENWEFLDDSTIFFQQYWGSVFDEDFHDGLNSQVESIRPLKQLKTCNDQYSFGNTTNCKLVVLNKSQDRNLVERNRRERLSQRFLALSSLLPNLKKKDKASILEEAIKYMIQLQEKVEILEKKLSKKAATNIKRWDGDEDDVVKWCSNQRLSIARVSTNTESVLPLMKVKMYEREILINIHYEKRKGINNFEKIVGEIERKLHLSVVRCSVVPFGDSHLNITIIAKMEEEFSVCMEEVLNNLHAALHI